MGRPSRRRAARRPRRAARGQAHAGAQQRRRASQPQPVLGVHGARLPRPSGRPARRGHRGDLRVDARAQAAGQRRRRGALRQRLGVAGPRWRRPRCHLHGEPGLAADARPHAPARRRRLGARLLPQIPAPARRLPRGLVERRRLAASRRALRDRHEPPTPEEITHDQHASCPRRSAGHARRLRSPLARPSRRARRRGAGRPGAGRRRSGARPRRLSRAAGGRRADQRRRRGVHRRGSGRAGVAGCAPTSCSSTPRCRG